MNNSPLIIISIIALEFLNPAQATDSTCFGTTKHGRLENAIKLPDDGNNFTSYSSLAALAGRTWVHSKVYDTVITAYKILEVEQPDKVYKYAETGYQQGGIFKPHKTHQNGLSIDFMAPVLNKKGESEYLPTHVFNKFGYAIEFDKNSRYKEYTIDYEALAAHLVALHIAAIKHNIGIWRVIFDPELQPNLYKTKYSEYIKKNIKLSTKRSWVRHDEHYHVDFRIKCKKI